MGSMSRREREKEKMRIAILEAAISIIADEGYENLSMRKIADAIEYTATTIYSYYEDKAQIIADISREVYRSIVINVKNVLVLNKNLPIDKQLELCLKEFVFTIAKHPEAGKAVIRSGTIAVFGPDEDGVLPEENGILILRDALENGQQHGVLRKLDENTPWMLVTALIGFSMNMIENKLYENDNWNELVDAYVGLLMNGILPGKE